MQNRLPMICFLIWIVFHAPPTPTALANNQSDVIYQISAELDTAAQKLTGRMLLTYRNTSKNTIQQFYLQAPSNAFADSQSTAFRELQRFNRGNIWIHERNAGKLTIHSLQFLVIGERRTFPIQAFDFSDTILELPLPYPLAPGDTLKLQLQFEKILPRRPNRRHRRLPAYDFVDWFPRVPVLTDSGWRIEPFHFMMERSDVQSAFAAMDVTLKVPGSFAVAGSGSVSDGDPGWRHVQTDTARARMLLAAHGDSLDWQQRDSARHLLTRTVRFRVDRAQNFLWSASPAFRYYVHRPAGAPPVHVLARDRQSIEWEKAVLERIDSVLSLITSAFGPLQVPSLTIVQAGNGIHAQPGFLMLEGQDDFGLAYGLAKMLIPGTVSIDGYRESWFSKGLAVYMGKRAAELHYGPRGYQPEQAQEEMNWLQRRYPLPTLDEAFRSFSLLYMNSGRNEAIAKAINAYSDPISAAFNLYLKAEIFFEMLEYVIGREALQTALRRLVNENRYAPADARAFQRTCEQITGENLRWFFDQWLLGTPTIDYAKGKVKQHQRADGTWVTEVEIVNRGNGRMPIEVELELADGRQITRRWSGAGRAGKVIFETAERPRRIDVDPHNRIMDANRLNNRSLRFIFEPDLPLLEFFHMPSDAYLVRYRPLFDYNDVDGFRLGAGLRGSYRIFYHKLDFSLTAGLRSGEIDGVLRYDRPLRTENLLNRYRVMLRKAEGRYETGIEFDFRSAGGILSSSSRVIQLGLNYSGVSDLRYTLRHITSDTGTVRFQDWERGRVLLTYGHVMWRCVIGRFDSKIQLRSTAGITDSRTPFARFAARTGLTIPVAGFRLNWWANAGGSIAFSHMPLQDRFRIAEVTGRQSWRAGVLLGARDYRLRRHRIVEGGARLLGYAGDPTPVRHYLSTNLEVETAGALLGFRLLAFGDFGRLWLASEAGPRHRADAGVGLSFLAGPQQFFGGALPIMRGLSAKLYLPFWLSHPVSKEKALQFRWFFTLGTSF